MNELLQLLKGQRFQLHNEKALQAEIEALLIRNQVQHHREYYLSKGSIIDFLVEGTGIEVKISGSAISIFRQLERYCEFDDITGIILLTNKAMGIPSSINNKPAILINLGKAWL